VTEKQTQTLCVVAPCYNEAEVIGFFYEQLKQVLNSLPGLEHRILFIDDGSHDGTLAKLNALAERDPAIEVYSLSRNFGHQVALSAGLDAARGDAVVMMDSDLQHPPALIPRLVQFWREGNDVVSAVRNQTADSTLFKRATSKLFYRVLHFMTDTPIVPGAADFCLLSCRAHQALCQLPERHRFLRGMVSWIGFQRAFVTFDAPPRLAGRSKYTTLKMFTLALHATFSFSVTPIRMATQLGFITIGLSLLYLTYILAWMLAGKGMVPGWTSLIFVTTFLGGVQLAFIGVVGEYIARIFEEVKGRPMYLLKQKPDHAKQQRADSFTHRQQAGH
jgi:dolichol-phosphate mannosyltransferase